MVSSLPAPSGDALAILYVDYEFPGLTTTFTWREVEILRSSGVDVHVLSTRPAREELLPESARALVGVTTYVRRPGIAECVGGLIRVGVRKPRALMTCLRLLAAPVRPLSKYPSYVFHLAWAAVVASSLELDRYDCIHAPFAAGQGSMAMFLSTLLGRPLWITSHAYDLYADRIALRQKLERSALFVTISAANKQWLESEYGEAARGVRVSYLGVDPARIAYRDPVPRPSRARLISVGSLNPKKGHDVLLRALATLKQGGVDFECTIIGEGPQRDQLEKLARSLELDGCVNLVGSVSNDIVQQLVGEADVFVLACTYGIRGDRDGIPVALMEAMAMGVPVVSTRISGIPELVHDGETGFLADPGDQVTLACAIERAIGRGGDRVAVAAQARHLIETRFDQHVNTQALLVEIRSAIMRWRGAHGES